MKEISRNVLWLHVYFIWYLVDAVNGETVRESQKNTSIYKLFYTTEIPRQYTQTNFSLWLHRVVHVE